MRSLLIATAICAAMTFTGCSFTVSGPCTSLTHQNRLPGECGCNADSGCDTCTPGAMFGSLRDSGQAECGTTNFGDGAPCGLEGMRKPKIGGGLFARAGGCGCNEEVPCDGGCSDAGCGCESESMVSTGAQGDSGQLGMGIFQKGTACSDGSCGRPGLPMPNGALRARMGSHFGGHGGHAAALASRGCGRFGCGREGKLCLSCKGKLRSILHGANSGPIPHQEQPPMGMGGPAGAAPSYVYPYYTTRGPRDFLMANPPSIGY